MSQAIFIVEDDNLLARMYATKLELTGFRVECFGDASSCLDRCRTKQPDLFLVDILLPGMNGLKLTKEIRKQAQAVDIPIVILTNLHPVDVDLKDDLADSLGIKGFFVKSQTTPQQLTKNLQSILSFK